MIEVGVNCEAGNRGYSIVGSYHGRRIGEG